VYSSEAGADQFQQLQALHERVKGLYPSLKDHEAPIFIKYLAAHMEWLKDNEELEPLTKRNTPVTFNCTTYAPSASIPSSVHRLRPADIKVVAALGDSMTAAFGAKATSLWQVLTEYRGVSWSIGGDEDIQTEITMPNILRAYNPNLIGYSVKTGRATSANSRYNRAVTASRAADLPQQAEELVAMMRNDASVNMKVDWKIITIWIGGNDLCDICGEPDEHSPQVYQAFVRDTLRILKEGIPRLYVNLALGIDVTQLYDVNSGLCSLLHIYECSCATDTDSAVRAQVQKAARDYNDRLISLRAEDEFNNSEEFTIVIQPFLKDTGIPRKENGKPDMKYFSPDCFHFSHLGHEAAAVALWNNMVEPVPTKLTQWTIGEPIECPAENQFFFTHKNSLLYSKQ